MIKYAIYRDIVKLYFPDRLEKEVILPLKEFSHIADKVKESRKRQDDGFTDFGYLEVCNGCNKHDYVVQGYCRSCFIMMGLKYETDKQQEDEKDVNI